MNHTCRSTLKTNKRDRKEEYVTTSELKQRGWTPRLIGIFAGEPDKFEKNIVYRSGPKMKLYLLKRIRKIERTKKFKEAKEKAKRQKESAIKSAETKRQRTLDYVNSVHIKVPTIDKESLIELACASYNEWHDRFSDLFVKASPDSDEKFISRICVNYLRHQCTMYEKDLDKIFGAVGVQEAHDILKKRVNDAIFEKYQWLMRDYH